MLDFAWLLEEILLRQRDVGFSGQLRVLVQHSLTLLAARITLYHLSPVGDILVVPEASAVALKELSRHSATILPVFAGEAVGGEERGVFWGVGGVEIGDAGGRVTPRGRGDTAFPAACAIHALLMEMAPFLGVTVAPSAIVLSQDELSRKTLELLRLLPPNLLGLQVRGLAAWGGTAIAWKWLVTAACCLPPPLFFLLSPSPASPWTA